MLQIRRLVPAVLLAVCAMAPQAFSQFSYSKLADQDVGEFQRSIQPFTHPRYNRVEGLFLDGGVTIRPEQIPGLTADLEAGWGLSNETDQKFRFSAGIRKQFLDFDPLTLGAEVFRRVDSEDDWIAGDVENSLFSLLFREDYKDYYGVTGFRVFVDKKFAGSHTGRIEVSRRTYDALRRNVNWSVFKGNFQENPARSLSTITEGSELSIKLIAALDWRDNPIFPMNGWYVQGIYEHTLEDFDTDGFFLTVQRYQQTFGSQRLILRGMAGSRTGSLAEQHSIDLGGIGSLRAFDDKEFGGNRMVMLNANYLFAGDLLQKVPLQNIPFLGAFWTTLSLGLFMDTGWADLSPVGDGLFSGFDNLDLNTDFGVSLLVLEGVFRMDVARRTSSTRGRDDYRITFRLLDTF